MKIVKSLCPICYEEIQAVITVADQVYMVKECKKHGLFKSVVERSPEWYLFCERLGDKNIYDGYMIDVTGKCNLNCRYCYHDKLDEFKSADEIISDAKKHAHLTPYILTGGEPTLYKELPRIVRELSRIAETWVLTNGVELCKEECLDKLIASFAPHKHPFEYIGLSFHGAAKGKDLEFLDLCRKKGVVLGTAFYVIDSLEQIDFALDIYKQYKDVIAGFRIKAASNLWNEDKVGKHIYVSDMLLYLEKFGKVDIVSDKEHNNKTSFCCCTVDGLYLMLISWYDAMNVDLDDIDCGPWYKAKDGEVYNFVTAALKNNEFQRNTGLSIRRASVCDLEEVSKLWLEMAVEENPEASPDRNIWALKADEFIKCSNNHLYIAEVCGEIVGFVQGFWDYCPIKKDKYIVGLHFYVRPEYRKGEVAIALHSKYKQVGHDLGVKRVVRQTTFKNGEHLKAKGQREVALIIEESI
jgi:organic radical activating enzyme/GNAT superfamily N-acetyltransferase